MVDIKGSAKSIILGALHYFAMRHFVGFALGNCMKKNNKVNTVIIRKHAVLVQWHVSC